jgi:hypothetical protein
MGASNSKTETSSWTTNTWTLVRNPTPENCQAFLERNFGSQAQIKQHFFNVEALSAKIGDSTLVKVVQRVIHLFIVTPSKTLDGGGLLDLITLGITKQELYSLVVCIGLGWLFVYAYQVLATQQDIMVTLFKVLTGWKTSAILAVLAVSFSSWEKPFKRLFHKLFSGVGIGPTVYRLFQRIVASIYKLLFVRGCELCKRSDGGELVRVQCGSTTHKVHAECYARRYAGACPVCKQVVAVGDDQPDDIGDDQPDE